MLTILFFWLMFALVVGMIASSRGRSGFGWFILACFISPLLAGIFLLAGSNLTTKAERPNPSTHVKCPDCAELVLKEARVCKHCGCRLVSQTAEPEPSRLKTIIGDIPDTGASKVLYWVGVAIVLAVIIWISKH